MSRASTSASRRILITFSWLLAAATLLPTTVHAQSVFFSWVPSNMDVLPGEQIALTNGQITVPGPSLQLFITDTNTGDFNPNQQVLWPPINFGPGTPAGNPKLVSGGTDVWMSASIPTNATAGQSACVHMVVRQTPSQIVTPVRTVCFNVVAPDERCAIDWDTQFCILQQATTVPITVCNDSSISANFDISIQPELGQGGIPGAGIHCNVDGPPGFTFLDPVPVFVAGNDCSVVDVKVDRPVGFNQALLTSCFEATITNQTAESTSTCRGSVQDRRDICSVIIDDPWGYSTLTVGERVPFDVELTNTGFEGSVLPYRVTPYRRTGELDAMIPNEAMQLDDAKPGTSIKGTIELPPGSQGTISFEATYREQLPWDLTDIVIETDANGDGYWEPLISAGVRPALPECAGNPELGDRDRDGFCGDLDCNDDDPDVGPASCRPRRK